jgi:predicted CoA-binding protein
MTSIDPFSFEVAKKILTEYKVFAVVGCSSDPWRDSNSVGRYLIDSGYDVIPVNPNEEEALGRRCYPDLESVRDRGIEVVDIFRRSDAVGGHVDEAIAIGAKAIWMQLGVIDAEAAERAAAAGMDVVMDRCPRIDLPRLAHL